MEARAEYPRLVIKYNNMCARQNCTLCGASGKAHFGPTIFVEGAWGFVCDICAQQIAPALYEEANRQRDVEMQRLLDDDGFDADFWGEALQ